MICGHLRHARPATVLLVAEALGLAVTIEPALRLLPFARLLDLIERLDRPGTPRAVAVDEARLARVVAAVYRLLPLEGACLRQSLVLLALLRRRGRPARLQIGVSKAAGRFSAHAWVEAAGRGTPGGSGEFFPLTPIHVVASPP